LQRLEKERKQLEELERKMAPYALGAMVVAGVFLSYKRIAGILGALNNRNEQDPWLPRS
jgi:hypothetical protein